MTKEERAAEAYATKEYFTPSVNLEQDRAIAYLAVLHGIKWARNNPDDSIIGIVGLLQRVVNAGDADFIWVNNWSAIYKQCVESLARWRHERGGNE